MTLDQFRAKYGTRTASLMIRQLIAGTDTGHTKAQIDAAMLELAADLESALSHGIYSNLRS